MDSNEEEMVVFFEEEAEVVAADYADDEHNMILTSLMAMYVRDTKPRRRGSKKGRMKSKPMQRFEGYCMLYFDNFANNQSHKVIYFGTILG
jgi:hypothetical protein